jgi:hypothetical protein
MIAFACKQCGKRYERPEETSGTLVFCACGAGTRVPYESSLPPMAQPLDPLPPRVERPAPRWDTGPAEPQPLRYWGQQSTRDRSQCLNHGSVPAAHSCADCGEGFCASCAVAFQGSPRCGPCKNFRVRAVQRPPHVSVMAIFAPLIAIGAGGFWLFLLLFIAGLKLGPGAVAGWGIIGLFPQLLAFTLAALAEMKIESSPRISGRSWAMTGMVAAVVCASWILLMMALVMQAV